MPGDRDRLQTTKLAIPHPSRKLIHRPRVVGLLSGALDARLVLVSAPPGFGKTTTVVDWLAGSGIRSAWISLDESDNDPVRFRRYLRAGIETLAADGTVREADAQSSDDLVETADELASMLAVRPEPQVLVLDDYHLISAAEVQRVVSLLLERLPRQAHLLIATRADPALPLARLRARGELLELRADALRFTADETRAFLTEQMGLELSDDDVATLAARTEGWPAVLQLAGLSLARREDVARGVREFAATHRFVLDYVVEEILAGLPPDTQDFLLRTSVLARLSGQLCDAVTRGHGGQARLEELDRANLLIIPLDDERRWYRYHALFGEILRARLAALHPDEVAKLHARASAWHMQHGDDEEAVTHGIRSDDLDRTIEFLAMASLRHINAGELGTVRRWLDALPPEIVRGHPQLSASYAWCLTLAGETEGVAERLADVERAIAAGRDGGPIAGPIIPAELALLRTRLATLQGDTAAAIAQSRLARSLVPTGLSPAGEATLRGDASVLLANALLRAGDAEAAAEAYAESLADLRTGGNVFAVGRAIADMAAISIARGDPENALRLCESELQRGAGQSSAAASPALWAAIARARAELGQADLADEAARRALALATRAGDSLSARAARATLERVGPFLAGGTAEPRRRFLAGPGGPYEALSRREVEVLRLVALGRSNSEIARELFVTVGTVKAHVHSICGKLGAANRVQAIVRGRELRLLD